LLSEHGGRAPSVTPSLVASPRSFHSEPPAFQWDMGRGAGPRVVRLFGHLGERELQHVIAAIRERGRSPRDLVCLDFEQVTHVDYRALYGLASAMSRQANKVVDI